MAENLNIGTRIDAGTPQNDQNENCSPIQKYCYDQREDNCSLYGGLYQHWMAMCGSTLSGAQGICPDGWHVPTHYEWTTLERTVCSSNTCSTDFPYDTITTGWRGTDEGTKLLTTSGFDALLGGGSANMTTPWLYDLGVHGFFWTSTTSSGGGGGGTSQYYSSGYLISSTFDTGTSQTDFTTITWLPTSQNSSTNVKFQIAANNDNLTWNFTGPDGTGNSFYTAPDIINSSLDNNRYVRYKVILETNDLSITPVVTNISINYNSGCRTPGQVIFTGLAAAGGYTVTVSMNGMGYQTKIIPDIEISGNDTLEILLSH
jgi:uncharacterized protein (TIGR02145 family)